MRDNCMMTPGTGTTRPSCQCPASRAAWRCRGQATSSSTPSRQTTLVPTSVRWLPYYYVYYVSSVWCYHFQVTNGIGRPQRATAHLEVTCEYLWKNFYDDTISGGDDWIVFFHKQHYCYIVQQWDDLFLVANEMPESLIIALLIRTLHPKL